MWRSRLPHPTISKFPALARCSASIAFDWDRSYVGDLLKTLDQDGHDFGLAETELALAKLLTRFNLEDLAEQIEDLFSSDPLLSQAKWEKACTELYAFAYFEDRGLLYSLGWPPGYSDTPPFDFRAQISGTVLLCDAKPASGNGLEMVRKAIAPVIESWRVDRGIEDLQTSLDYRGTITQQALGTPLRETTALADFGVELDRHTEIPDGPLRIMLGASRIDVTLTGPGQARMSGGIQGVRPLVLSLAPTVAKHVKQKARLAAENGFCPFHLGFRAFGWHRRERCEIEGHLAKRLCCRR